MKKVGILIVSHVYELVYGLTKLLKEVAPDVSITYSGGVNKDEVGTNIELIKKALNNNEGKHVLAFYDLGSSKMKLDMILEDTKVPITLVNAPLVEGSYAASVLAQIDLDEKEIIKQLEPFLIK